MDSLIHIFMKNYNNIREGVNVYAWCINYEFFFKEKPLSERRMNSIKEELLFQKSWAENSKIMTFKQKIIYTKERLIKEYNDAYYLKFNKYTNLRSLFEKEINKISKEKSANKIILYAKKIRREIDIDCELSKLESESKPVQIITQKIDLIIQFDTNKGERWDSKKIRDIEKKLNKELIQYAKFLGSMSLIKLLSTIYNDDIIYNEMRKNNVSRIFTKTDINLFFMYLVCVSIDKTTKYKILIKREHIEFWEEYKNRLEIFHDMQKDQSIIKYDCYCSDKVTPDILKAVIQNIKNGKSPSAAIIEVIRQDNLKTRVSEGTIRKWIKRNANIVPEYKNKGYAAILENIEEKDIDFWFEKLGKIDPRFQKQIDNSK